MENNYPLVNAPHLDAINNENPVILEFSEQSRIIISNISSNQENFEFSVTGVIDDEEPLMLKGKVKGNNVIYFTTYAAGINVRIRFYSEKKPENLSDGILSVDCSMEQRRYIIKEFIDSIELAMGKPIFEQRKFGNELHIYFFYHKFLSSN